jgi:DNA-binding NtrC family response regulator
LRVTILLVCPDESRMNRLKDAIHSAGFRLISAKAVDEAWAKSDFFDFGAVIIDHELKNDVAAAAFRARFITLNLQEGCSPDAVGLELSDIFNKGSELVQ